MFKKINILFLAFTLVGCTTVGPQTNGGFETVDSSSITESNFGEASSFRVGMLLPLTGHASSHGQGLRNAALLALEDVKNPKMLLQFYDTKSSEEGAIRAAENAINQKAQLIIGPLMAEEVRAISKITTKRNIPVVAFSTNHDVLKPGIYSLGLLVNEQVDRVMTYAVREDRKNFAILIPDTNTGITVAKSAIVSAQKNGVNITSIAFYPPEISDFSEALRELTNYTKRSERINNIKKIFKEKSEAGDINAKKLLQRLETIDTLGNVDFDAILISEQGTRLKSAVAMLDYYDVSAPKVKILGTSMWETSNLIGESGMIGAWYPTLSRRYDSYFINKYRNLFGEKPRSIYAFGYDAVALASSIASNENKTNLHETITNINGYVGVNGIFRIFPEGTNEHSLDIVEIRRSGETVINPSPKSFSFRKDIDIRNIYIPSDYIAPKIFGKDPFKAQELIFGRQLSPENQPSYTSQENEEDIIRESLAEYKIVIPQN